MARLRRGAVRGVAREGFAALEVALPSSPFRPVEVRSAVMAAKKNKASSRVVIGVDPHKRIDAVVVLDELGVVLAR